MYLPFRVFCFIVLFCVSFVCKCVLYYCHQEANPIAVNKYIIPVTTFILIKHGLKPNERKQRIANGLKPNERKQRIAITVQNLWVCKSDNGDSSCPYNVPLTFQYTWWWKSTKLTISYVIYRPHNA